MDIKGIGSIEESPIKKLAALIIIFAGAIYAKSIIAPFLLALFISIVCMQPITWLGKKRIPRSLAILIVILGMVLLFSGYIFLIGGTLSFFLGNVSKNEATITGISNSVIQFLNDQGLKVPKDQISTLVQPDKILEFTSSAVKELFKMLGSTFLTFLILLFIIHNVLGNFIEPKLMGKGLGLSTLVVVLSLLFWGFILGPVGMFLAVPFTLTIKIILEQNENARWLEILLGTPAKAKIYLQNKEQVNKKLQKDSLLKENNQTNI